jgi:ABC-2 type transport system ATP-binding protein
VGKSQRKSMMSPVIHAHNLGKNYGKNPAVEDVTFSVEPGQIVGLIGPNGAGKTTVMRMLLDIIRPTSGTVTVLGEEPQHAPASLRERIGYLPGELRISTRATAKQVLGFFADVSGPVTPGAIDSWAERFGLDLTKPVKDLSKGNKQKVGLIQALMHQPELLILDEPTSGLDPLIQREFLSVLQEIKASGRTVLLSSHVLGEIQQSADRVIVLSSGRLVADSPVDSLALANLKHVKLVVSAAEHTYVLGVLERSGISSDITSTELGDLSVAIEFPHSGHPKDLIRTLGGIDLVDVSITEPDLEDSVLSLYDGEKNLGANDG